MIVGIDACHRLNRRQVADVVELVEPSLGDGTASNDPHRRWVIHRLSLSLRGINIASFLRALIRIRLHIAR
jgi:hypothetical protein